MNDYKYIVVGGGMTADSAVKGIRENDANGRIAAFSDEPEMPYNRPPLSKGLWKGESPESVWRETEGPNLDFHKGTRVTSIHPADKTIKTGGGQKFSYEKLLLATGGSPRRLPFGVDDVIYFRTLDDYRRLRAAAEKEDEFVIIGGGFIGSEVAAALAMNGKRVTMILSEAGICARIFPQELSTFLVGYFAEKGVEICAGDTAVGIEKVDSKSTIRTKKGKEFKAATVVAGLGILPNDSLARSAGLAVDNGIVVDAFLRTTNHDIFAAGDVANFYYKALDKRVRVEHEDNSNSMGVMAGRNMTGRKEAYNHIPLFYSDMFDLGYEAVGELDSRMDVVEDWVERHRKGVVYYMREGYVKGVLLWNTWGKVEDARELLKSRRRWTRDELVGKIRD